MKLPDFNDLDLNVARIRIVLSLVAILSLYIDPSVGGLFTLDAVILRILLCHLAYSLAVYFALKRSDLAELVPKFTAAVDLVFATAVAVLTEGSTSPSYIFFLFAIIAVGFRNGFRAAITDTAVSMALYLTVIALSHGATNLIIMRVVYLAIAGLLIGFFGQQRAAFEARLREFEMKTERETIARSLHDGYVQALAAVNLRLESCRELLSRGQTDDAFNGLTELQRGVAREFDAVRTYVRSLAEIDQTLARDHADTGPEPVFNVNATFTGRGLMVEQILQIVLEGIRNAWRHGNASSVQIGIEEVAHGIRIVIDDNGRGFSAPATEPWTIASRVAECGGNLTITSGSGPGARLEIDMPAG